MRMPFLCSAQTAEVKTAGIDLCCLLNLFAELQPTMNQEPANRELYKSKGAFCNGT